MISVIVPAYNVEEYIYECLESIIVNNAILEIIVVDDGSKDKTNDRVVEFVNNNPDANVNLIYQDNAGLSSARNRGLSECTGDYVLFIDSDDVFFEFAIDNLYAAALHSGAEITIGTTQILAEDGRLTRLSNNFVGDFCGKDLLSTVLVNKMSNVAWGKLVKRELLFNCSFFPEGRLFEDFSVVCQWFLGADLVTIIDNDTVKYRKRNGSISNTYNFKIFEDSIFLFFEFENILKKIGNDEFEHELNSRLAFIYILNINYALKSKSLKDYFFLLDKFQRSNIKLPLLLKKKYLLSHIFLKYAPKLYTVLFDVLYSRGGLFRGGK